MFLSKIPALPWGHEGKKTEALRGGTVGTEHKESRLREGNVEADRAGQLFHLSADKYTILFCFVWALQSASAAPGHTGKAEHFSKCYYKVQMKSSCSY